MSRKRIDLAGAALALVAIVSATPAAGQESAHAPLTKVYEREVFSYPRGGRVDPFRSLLKEGEMGVRIENLELRGIVLHSEPERSVAVLTEKGTERRIQARVGERVGSVRVVAISSETVEVIVEELGVARRETLRIVRPQPMEGNS
jgi:hypothetical protein